MALPTLGDAFEILRSRPHGHVAAALGCARRLGLEKLLDRRPSTTPAETNSTGPWTGCSSARTASSATWRRGHLEDGALVLCDITSVYFEGSTGPLARLGYSCDGKRGKPHKGLSRIERAFRSYKTVDLKVRPVHHRLEGQVRAHVFLCMLAYYVEWQRLL